jgi:hypothetical protein
MNPTISKTEQVNFTVDAIAMKRQIQEQIYEDTKDMTPEEFIAYMHQRIASSQFVDFLKGANTPTPG